MSLPSALIRPIAQPEEARPEAAETESAESQAGQGREEQETRPSPKPRRRRAAATESKTSKRGLYLPDAVWERLQLESIRKRTSVSAIAGDVLERNLPRLRIERDS